MLAPLRSNRGRGPTASGQSTPAPVGGWDAKYALADMKPHRAVLLDNWFPETSHVRLRRGFAEHATGVGSGPVEGLMEYASGSARKMLAAADGEIFDVTSSGSASSLASGFTNDRWQHTNFGTAGGQFLIMVNGADSAQKYDGSTVSATSITGPSNPLVGVTAHNRRLFFVEEDSLKFWYLAVVSIAGSASSFDLAPLCKQGGYLMAIGTWSRDGGAGADDLAVFITSQGEAVVYAGTDPGTADDWQLVGVFRIGAPVGRRCIFKVGADLVVITQDGFLPLSKVLTLDRTSQQVALSDMISNAVTAAVRSHGSKFGWQALLYPRANMGIFNVPTRENQEALQYVMNTQTGAWCRFKDMNANCWSLLNDELYFGGNDGAVFRADSGFADDGANIRGDVLTAFNYFGSRGLQKRFTMIRPILSSDGDLPISIECNVDFDDKISQATPTFIGGSGPLWDQTDWDEALWASRLGVRKSWQSVTGIGYCAALRMGISVRNLEVTWQSVDWLFERGGYI